MDWTHILSWFIGWFSMGVLIVFFEWYYKKYKNRCISCDKKLKSKGDLKMNTKGKNLVKR